MMSKIHDEEQKLDGAALDQTVLNLMMYGEIDPEFPTDPESLEARRKAKEMMRGLMPKNNIGRPIVFSTVGDLDRNDTDKLLWNEWTPKPEDNGGFQ